jgi:hypothetical protein
MRNPVGHLSLRTLELGREQLIAATPDAVHAGATRIPVDELHAFATVGNELWIAAGAIATLQRFDLRGERIGDAIALGAPGDAPRLVRGHGEHVVWRGAKTMRLSRETDGVAARDEANADLILPISSVRMLAGDRATLSLRDGATVRWSTNVATGGRIVDGELLLDAQLAAAVVKRQEASTIVVVGMRDGVVQHRINVVDADLVRFAARRGVAVVVSGRRRLVLIDLRYGRVLVDHELEVEIAELAIDGSGETIAMRCGDPFGEIVHVDVAELSAPARIARGTAPIVDEIDEPPPPSAPLALRVEDPFASTATFGSIPALPPLRTPEPIAPERLRFVLEAQRDLAKALVVRAIARGWDTGRIAFPDTRALPFRNEIAGAVGELAGIATTEVTDAERRLQNAREMTALLRSPLDELVDALVLAPIDRAVLLAIAAPTLWGELARLYGILANDTHRPLCDEQLVVTILDGEFAAHDVAAALDAHAPLARLGLVRTMGGTVRPFLPLVADPVVVQLLRGGAVDLAPTRRLAATRTLAELYIPADAKDRAVRDLACARGPLRVAVRGRAASGRRTLLAAIAASTNRELAVIDVAATVRGPRGSVEDLRAALQRAQLVGLVPCIEGHDRIGDDLDTRERVARVLREHPGPLTARVDAGASLPFEGCVEIALPAHDHVERLAAWTQSLARESLVVDEIEPLADRFAVGPATIAQVTAEVAAAPGDDPVGRLDAAIRQRLHTKLHAIADRVERLATWSQIVLPPDVLDSLTELIGRIRHRRTVYDRWGFDRVMKTSRGITALFQGGPGTGKTLVASAIANELGLDLYRVDLSRVMSKWIGETERNLAALFDAAEDGHAIILFDEADSLFAKRTDVKSSVDRYANLEVNYLLQRLDSFEGIAILTTNLAGSIDAAFKRRMSFRLTFPFPDDDERARLWRAHIPNETPSRELDLHAIARRYRLSGGYIRNCALRAAFIAAEEGCRLGMDHLERAIQSEFRELGKLGNGGILE